MLICSTKFTTVRTIISLSSCTHGCKSKPRTIAICNRHSLIVVTTAPKQKEVQKVKCLINICRPL